MDDVKEHEDLNPELEEVLAAIPTEASLRVQATDLLLVDGARYEGGGRPWSRAMSSNKSKQAPEGDRSVLYPPEHR